MADGQADTPAPETLSDLAKLLDTPNEPGNPQEEAKPTKQASTDTDEPQGDDDKPDEDATPAPDDEDEDDDAKEGDDEDAPDADKPTSERKLKVTIKGDDGADVVQELPEAEVVKGYMRQADYTRSKQELARQSNEAFQVMTKHVEDRTTELLETSQKQLMAIQALAGLRTPEEMAQLAVSDPSAWVQEQQRERAIAQVASQIEANMAAEKQRLKAQQEHLAQQQFAQAWGTLGQAGIDKPKLKAIFDVIKRDYGIPEERFNNINDPKLVFIMRDAAAYRALQAKKPTVTQKAKAAPPMPAARAAQPASEKLSKRINDRFKSGHAKVDDLAAYLAINKL